MRAKPVIVWFRDDLRLDDHPALHAAAAVGAPLLALFIHDEDSDGLRPLGAASRWWLHHSLERLAASLRPAGGLHLFRGAAAPIVAALLEATETAGLYMNRRYGQPEREVDAAVREACAARQVPVHEFPGSVLHEPDAVKPKSGGFFKVFTPYWHAAEALGPAPKPLPPPRHLGTHATCPRLDAGPVPLAALKLLPTLPWDAGLRETWHPGEQGAREALDLFLQDKLKTYATDRDRLGITGSSRLSPHLRFGEISPRRVAAALAARAGEASTPKFAAELGWRDFNTAILAHTPDLATTPFRQEFRHFPHAKLKPADLQAWRRGRTGYPIVDAGMRQLWHIGTMHNRVRMITASFLVKHLLADWQVGERWFWDTLCDADPANNPVNWQWVAGCGNDPVPYFRIFNPVLQGEKFDQDGAYVRQWVPELTQLSDRWIHKPWEAPPADLEKAGVTLGRTYPAPIVDHAEARARALDALKRYRAILDETR